MVAHSIAAVQEDGGDGYTQHRSSAGGWWRWLHTASQQCRRTVVMAAHSIAATQEGWW